MLHIPHYIHIYIYDIFLFEKNLEDDEKCLKTKNKNCAMARGHLEIYYRNKVSIHKPISFPFLRQPHHPGPLLFEMSFIKSCSLLNLWNNKQQ